MVRKSTIRARARKKRVEKLEKKLNRVGRPDKFKAEYMEIARNLAMLGMTLEELATALGVSIDTICEWQKVIPEFSEAIKDGGARADGRVAMAMFKNATGHEGEKVFYDAKARRVVRVKIRHVPDTVAGIFWLKNRDKDRWKDRHDLTNSDGSFSAAFSNGTIEESRELESKLLRKHVNGNGTDSH